MDIMGFFELPAVRATLLLALAFVVATVARFIADRVVGNTVAADALTRAERAAGDTPGRARSSIGTLAFLVVFLLFVPGIFGVLGIDAAGTPILGMLNTVWGYLPNIVGAAVIMAIGLIVARLVRQLLVPALESMGVNRLQERAGIKVTEDARLSVALAYLAYAAILVPVVVVALQTLGISAIADPATDMLDAILLFLPNVVVAALISAIGLFIARIAGQVTERVVGTTGIDARVSSMARGRMGEISISSSAAMAVQVIIAALFLVEAFDVIQLDVLSDIGNAAINFLPSAFVAAVVAVGAVFAGNLATRALEANDMSGYALPARIGIFAVAAFMVLSQLGVAPAIVNTAFIAMAVAVAVALAVAFGIGGREAAARVINRWTEMADNGAQDTGSDGNADDRFETVNGADVAMTAGVVGFAESENPEVA